MSACIRFKLRWEVPFKLIFILYNMKPLDFLAFFLTLIARGIRRQWKWKRTRVSSPSPFCSSSSLFSSSRWRTRLGRRRRCESHFLVLFFLWDLPLLGLESRWIICCSYFDPWEPSSLFSWSFLSLCTFLRLTSAIFQPPLSKGVKSWKRKIGVWALLLRYHDVGRIQRLIETETL